MMLPPEVNQDGSFYTCGLEAIQGVVGVVEEVVDRSNRWGVRACRSVLAALAGGFVNKDDTDKKDDE